MENRTQGERTPLVVAKVVAEHLALSEKQVYNLAAEGKLRSVRVGASVRFDWNDVDAFVDQHRIGEDD